MNEKTYPDEQLHSILNEVLQLIESIQQQCLHNKKAVLNNDLFAINSLIKSSSGEIPKSTPAPPDQKNNQQSVAQLKQSVASNDALLQNDGNNDQDKDLEGAEGGAAEGPLGDEEQLIQSEIVMELEGAEGEEVSRVRKVSRRGLLGAA